MSIRNLDSLFDPSSVAVIGASLRAGSIGAMVWRHLRAGSFRGGVYPVNPHHTMLDGVPVAARVADLPRAPELAIVCTPPATVPGLIAELGAAGTRAAVLITPGLDAAQRQAALVAARPHLLRLVGPGALGLLSPHIGLNASHSPIDATPGELAFVSQSDALTTAVLDWARARRIGFSHVVSLGETVDVDFGDMLDYLASDAKTRAILLYVESLHSAAKFMSAARAAARNKPVILVKAGRTPAGAQAARVHHGDGGGSDRVFDAAVRRAGMLRVNTLPELLLAAETLARFRGRVLGDDPQEHLARLFVLSNGGGAGVVAADAADHLGLSLAALAPATVERLDALLPPGWSRANPVDMAGHVSPERHAQILQALLDDPAQAPVLFVHAPVAGESATEVAQALLPLAQQHPQRLLGCWLGDAAVATARALFQDAQVPSYGTPEEALRAWQMFVVYRRNQALLLEAPPAGPPGQAADAEAARTVIARALDEGRCELDDAEAKAVLAAYGVPVVATRVVAADDDDAAVAAADRIGWPVALKLVSPQVAHKSDVGGVALDLADATALRAALQAMRERVRFLRPDVRIDGFSVQAMVRRGHARELRVATTIDEVFGPALLFGLGGHAAELVDDCAAALPPLNVPLARALVERTRVSRLLDGVHDLPPADRASLHLMLVAVARLLADRPEIVGLDINPLLLDAQGARALDLRLRLDAAAPGGAARFAVQPYPDALVESLTWQDRELTLRPIRPEDEAQHLAFLQKLSPEDVRLRVFYSRRSIERSELARLTQIDYAREMAFLATRVEADGREHTLGVVRAVTDPDNVDAEFGIIVRSDLKGQHLGTLLMRKMIAYLRARGTRRLVATVLVENERMLDVARHLGFTIAPPKAGEDTRDMHLVL